MRSSLLFLLVLVAPSMLMTAEEAVFTAQALPAQVDDGHSVQVVFEARWPSSWPQDEALVADPRRHLEGIIAAPPPSRHRSANAVTMRWQVDVMPPQQGLWQIPAAQLALEAPDGQRLLSAEALTIAVGPQAPLPQLCAPLLWWPEPAAPRALWPIIVISMLVVAVAVGIAWSRHRRPAAAPLFIRPLEELLQALHNLPGQPRPAAVRISAALRHFCGRRWIFDGVGATVQETMGHCAGHLNHTQIAELDDILARTERLCWQAVEPTPQSIDVLAEDIRAWVRSLTAAAGGHDIGDDHG